VEFNPPATHEDGLGDEETTHLDGEAKTLSDEGDEAGATEGNGHDEDRDA